MELEFQLNAVDCPGWQPVWVPVGRCGHPTWGRGARSELRAGLLRILGFIVWCLCVPSAPSDSFSISGLALKGSKEVLRVGGTQRPCRVFQGVRAYSGL